MQTTRLKYDDLPMFHKHSTRAIKKKYLKKITCKLKTIMVAAAHSHSVTKKGLSQQDVG